MTYRATFHRNRGGRTSYVMVEDHADGTSYAFVVRRGIMRRALITGALVLASLTIAPAADAAPRRHTSHDGTTTTHVDRTRVVHGDSEQVTTDVERTRPDGRHTHTHTTTTHTTR